MKKFIFLLLTPILFLIAFRPVEAKLEKKGKKGVDKATITEITSTTLPTTIKVIKESETITLNITDKTIILRKFGGKSNLSEIHIGDIVSARGTWMKVEDTVEDILDVRVLRGISIQKRFGTFWGKIDSIGDDSFVLDTAKKGKQAVKIDASTKIVNRKEETIAFSDLKVGHRVRVSGIWDITLKTIDGVKAIKDWSLPPTLKVTVSPTTPQPTIKID